MTQKLSNNSFIFFIFVAFILIYLKLGLVTHSKTFLVLGCEVTSVRSVFSQFVVLALGGLKWNLSLMGCVAVRLGQQLGEQVVAGVLKQVEHQLKALAALVVGVGDVVVVIALEADVVAHHHDFAGFVHRGGHAAQVGGIGAVHGHNQVEVLKVAALDTAAAVRQLIAPWPGMHTHATVGQVAVVIATGACRVNLKLVGQAALVHQPLHHPLCRRRPADVAQAHKQDAVFLVAFGHHGCKDTKSYLNVNYIQVTF